MTVGEKASSLPVVKASKGGADYIGWADNGSTVYWSMGPTLYRATTAAMFRRAPAPENAQSFVPPETGISLARTVRAAVLSRNAIENNRAFRRRAWRGFLTAFRFCFSVFLVVSVVLVFLALVAIMIIALTQSRDRGGGGGQLPLFFGPGGPGGGGGGGPYYHHHGGLNDNFWLYLYMRDIWWLTYWNEHEYRMHQRLHGEYGRGLRHGQPAKGAGGGAAPPGGDGGGGGGGGGRGQGGGGGRRPGPPDRDPPGGPGADWDRFLAEEDEAERGDGDKNRELSFIESVFAFVFGRGDPNEDLEHRRWRAVGLLLRANEGAVYAEQLAPFLDSYLLRDHRGRGGLDASAAMVRMHGHVG